MLLYANTAASNAFLPSQGERAACALNIHETEMKVERGSN